MFGCDPIPSEMLLRFHQPECRRWFSSLPGELFATQPIYLQRRPNFCFTLDNSERVNNQTVSESDGFNYKCPSCLQRNKKVAKHNSKSAEHKPEKDEVEENAEKIVSVQTVEKDGNEKFAVSVNVHGFEPDDIQVKIKNRWLEIKAQSEKKHESSGVTSFCQLHRKIALPDYVNPDRVTSFLDNNGYLSIEAPRQSSEQASQQDSAADNSIADTEARNKEVNTVEQSTTKSTEVHEDISSSDQQSTEVRKDSPQEECPEA